MRITARHLRLLIREEVAGATSLSTRVKEEELGATDDKMFNVKKSVEGLMSGEFNAIKGDADTQLGSDGFFVIDNASEYPVKVYLDNFGKAEGAASPFVINAGSRSKFIGFSKSALTRQDPRPAKIIVTSETSNDSPTNTTSFKLKSDAVDAEVADEELTGVLVKLTLTTGRIDAPREEAYAATRLPEVPAGWSERVAKAPLRVGARGADVKTAQELLVNYLLGIDDLQFDAQDFEIFGDTVAKIPEITNNDSVTDILKLVAKKITDSGPDGKFGPLTRFAVQIVQMDSDKLATDGVIGKDTAAALLKGAGDSTFSNVSGGGLSESILNRWSRLAGIMKD